MPTFTDLAKKSASITAEEAERLRERLAEVQAERDAKRREKARMAAQRPPLSYCRAGCGCPASRGGA